MNKKLVAQIISKVLCLEAVFMVIPTIISLFEAEYKVVFSFLITIAAILLFSLLVYIISRGSPKDFYTQEGLVSTGLSWIFLSLFGCLPFWISREVPDFIDAWFEIVSGFTTTGASILPDIEALSKGLLYWRSFSNWLGGMGVLVFLLALVPAVKNESAGADLHLLRAESPGPSVGKLTPKMRQSAKILYLLYIIFTVLCIIFLLFGGLPLFDSVCLAFSTAGTGGFSILNSSVGGYSYYIQNVVAVFMILFGVNFNIFYFFIIRQFKTALSDCELRSYITIIFVSVAMITANIYKMFSSLHDAFHHAFFQVASIMTTTGFCTINFEEWPMFSKTILICLMFIGGCAGSTGGGIKVIRAIIIGKAVRRNVRRTLNPRRIEVIKINNKTIDEKVINGVFAYLAVYCIIILVSILFVSFDNLSFGTNFSAVVACLNNIGPGIEAVGAVENYSVYGGLSKIILSLDMLLGRLEIYPILVLFAKTTWKKTR